MATFSKVIDRDRAQVIVTVTDDEGVVTVHTVNLFENGVAIDMAAKLQSLCVDADQLCDAREAAIAAADDIPDSDTTQLTSLIAAKAKAKLV